MRHIRFIYIGLLCLLSSAVQAQTESFAQRLPQSLLDVRPPSERVSGEPGNMRIITRSCRQLPLEQVRRRIVDIAVQEWAFFGFSTDAQPRTAQRPSGGPRRPFSYPRLNGSESLRLASSIAAYWSATPDSDWILQRQNDNWSNNGSAARWRDAWSAAFISWVICEAGLGDTEQFQRAIAHHTYIDQAIRAAQQIHSQAAYRAYEIGVHPIVPGDMLCRGSRPAYRSLAQRATQLGVGARSHCDLVVNVDEYRQQISVIGGNVRATVRMKIFAATQAPGQPLRPIGDNGRPLFAHLKLVAPAVEPDALAKSPTMQQRNCAAPASLGSSETTTGC